ncbi:hypothetical protein [Pseudomonas taetrolens]|uniref:hypothetical protein n=1 Tax=Pseudomonas taetrolens TaxID=47884 RepID=UPI0030DC3169
MSEATPLAPRLTIAFSSFAFGVVSTLIGAAVHYGELKSDLSSAKERISDFQKANDTLVDTLKKWRDSYELQAKILNEAQVRVQQLGNDRCNPIRADIDSIYVSINTAQSLDQFDRLSNLNRMMEQYQQTLRACYAASASSTHG